MLNLILVAISILVGVCLRYFDYSLIILGCLSALAFIVWLVICRIAVSCVRSWPRTATILFQSWYVVPIVLIVLTTYLTTWLAIELPNWFTQVAATEKKVVTGVILGAINSIFAAAWLDNAKDPNSSLWPNQRHRLALMSAYSGDESPTPDSELYYVVFGDTTKSNDVKGWGFWARWKRAKLISDLS